MLDLFTNPLPQLHCLSGDPGMLCAFLVSLYLVVRDAGFAPGPCPGRQKVEPQPPPAPLQLWTLSSRARKATDSDPRGG